MDTDICDTAVMSLKDEVAMLKDKIAHLKSQLEESENESMIAAELGQRLLEEKSYLEATRDDERTSYTAKIEEMTQENFNLAAKVEAQGRMLELHSREDDNETKLKYEQEKESLRSSYEKKLNELKKLKSATDDEVSQMNLKLQQKGEIIENLHKTIAEQKLKNKIVVTNTSLEGEMQELKHALQVCYEEKCQIEENLEEAVHNVQRKSLEVETFTKRMNELNEELEYAQKEQMDCYKHLEDAKNTITELRVEISQLEADLKSRGHSKKGNSLFGELEDKRVVAERNLVVFKVRYESLQKAHASAKNEILKMKNQVLAFLQTRSDRADRLKIEHLENDLSSAKAECNMLAAKLKRKEAQVNSNDPLKQVKDYLQTCEGSESSKDYAQLLLVTTEEYKKKIELMQKESERLRLINIAKRDELQDTQRKLYTSINTSDKHRNEGLRAKLNLDEMKNKFEAEKRKRLECEDLIKKLSTGQNSASNREHEEKQHEKNTITKALEKEQDRKRRKENVVDEVSSNAGIARKSKEFTDYQNVSPPDNRRELTDEEKKEKGYLLMTKYLPKELAEEYLQRDKENRDETNANEDGTHLVPRRRRIGPKQRKVSFKEEVDLVEDNTKLEEYNAMEEEPQAAMKQEKKESKVVVATQNNEEGCHVQ